MNLRIETGTDFTIYFKEGHENVDHALNLDIFILVFGILGNI